MKNVPERLQRAAIKLFVAAGNTDVSISELAREAKLARTTIYNNVTDVRELFETVAERITENTNNTLAELFKNIDDPAEQLSTVLQLPILRMHEDQLLGLFVIRFSLYEKRLRSFWRGIPAEVLERGIRSSRFTIEEKDIAMQLTQMSGALLSVMLTVADGHRGWREAARGLAITQLRSLGLTADEAKHIARKEVPEYSLGAFALA